MLFPSVIEHLQVAFQDQTLALYQFTSTSYWLKKTNGFVDIILGNVDFD